MATIKARRRPIRDGTERSNEPTCLISPVPSAPTEQLLRETTAWNRDDTAREVCRDCCENSNAAIGRLAIGSGFIAVIAPVTVDIFSL
jgi:hypothetical protein